MTPANYESPEDSESLPSPDILTREIAADLGADQEII